MSLISNSKKSLISRGIAVLLMSCDVSPKWINSENFSYPSISNFFFKKYSTAFTSWFVIVSIFFISRASLSLNSRYIFLKCLSFWLFQPLNSLISNLDREIKYSISIFSLYLISAFSEKKLDNAWTLSNYLRSFGVFVLIRCFIILLS